MPVLLPVLLITVATVFEVVVGKNPTGETQKFVLGYMKLIGNPNLAMIIAALFSIYLCWRVQGHSLSQLAEHVEDALLSGGVIILITAAGGAFGALLAMTQIQEVVKSFFEGSESGGLVVIVLAYSWQPSSGRAGLQYGSHDHHFITRCHNRYAADCFWIARLPPRVPGTSHWCRLVDGSWMNDSGFWCSQRWES